MNTSGHLLEYLRDLDKDFEESEGPTSPEDKQVERAIRQIKIDSIESLMPEELETIIGILRHRRDMLEWSLDDHYSRSLLKEVPEIVRRALKLEPLYVKRQIKGPAETYVREATRAYLFGFFQASVALSRSALEQSLRESLRSGASLLAQTDELLSLIRAAELSKLLDA